MAIEKKYLFKLTPNKRDVIINSSVLLNGYEDVEYPIPIIDTDKLGYVYDPDSFQFKKTEHIKSDYPYPVKMEISALFDKLPFYGANNKKSNDKIIYGDICPLKTLAINEYRKFDNFLYSSSDGTYDEGIFINIGEETNIEDINNYKGGYDKDKSYYVANYKIHVKIFWSDNKSHIDNNYISNWNSYNKEIGDFPFKLTLKPVISKIPSKETIGIKHTLPDWYNKNYDKTTLKLPAYEYNTDNGQLTLYKNLLYVPDNFLEEERNILKFKIDAIFTDPNSQLSVSAYTEAVINQNAYIGYKIKKAEIKFIYYKPVEIWSPTVSATYIKDRTLTTKVDKDAKNDFYTIDVSGNFEISENENDKTDKIKIYYNNADNNVFTVNGCILDNFCLNIFNENKGYDRYDKNLLNSDDQNKFIEKFNNCLTFSLNTQEYYAKISSLNKNYLLAYNIPKIDNNDIQIVPDNERSNYKLNITISNNNKSISCDRKTYRAIYQNYIIHDDKYYPCADSCIKIDDNEEIRVINPVNDTSYLYYPVENDIDINYINNPKNSVDTSVNDSSVFEHKIIIDNNGNSIETKYCVNQLLNDASIQIPRYGVYPILEGYYNYLTDVYDYTTDKIDTVKNNDLTDIEKTKDLTYIDISTNQLRFDLEKLADFLKNDGYIKDLDDNAIIQRYLVKKRNKPSLYGATEENINSYKIVLSHNALENYLRINGILIKDFPSYSVSNSISFENRIDPGIFTISLDNNYPINSSEDILMTITDKSNNVINGRLIVTNDENEKHLTNYDNKGYELNTQHHSSMLLRANPKLSGNIKLVVDKDYNLYLDTFKANAILNNKNVRKYPISSEGNYPRDIKKVFSKIPIKSIFGLPENSLKAHKVYTDYKDQYETMYEYGAETNTDSLYSENMKILAPLHIGNDVPEFFAIFRYDDIFNEETYNGKDINDIEKLKTLIKKSKVIKTFDLRTTTSIGQYLNNYKNMLSNYGQCYLQFIEQDYNQNSPYYRQGNNIWKGISVDRGILVNQSETTYFGSKILNSDIVNKQEMFNNYIIAGFERHNLIYSNIINLEFMFDDNDIEEYSMHRYFGLYLTANDFINYGYAVSSKNNTGNTVLTKYDENGNIYKGDENIYKVIFNKNYYDRLFFAITNNNAGRVQSDIDLKNFFKNYVTNTPDSNLMSLDSYEINIDKDTDKSFIILHFNKPIECGEHIKFIAQDYPIKSSVTDAGNTYETNNLTTEHIVYEIIASNDERLIETDYNINPYVEKQKCRYSENTYFYRISFYSQDLEYNDITASLDVQINRIIKCIEKFNTDIIKVGSYNDKSISIISSYNNMYVQHILTPKFDDFHYDYFGFNKQEGILSSLYTTNKEYTDSISFIKHKDIKYIENDIQANDNENDWIKNIDNTSEHNYLNNIGDLHCYVETEDPINIKNDTISYFNSNITYEMHALTNQSDYFDNYYCAFSNYCFETLGWRYNNVVKFKSTKDLNYTYSVNTDINDLVNKVKYPLIYNTNGIYDTVNVFNITNGYLRNNIWEPDNYKQYSLDNQQQFINRIQSLCVITNPYDVNTCMISTINPSLLITNKIHLYKPTEVSVAIMGITNIKDIDTTIDLTRTLHNEDNLYIDISAGETIQNDESDYRIQYGVMYEVINGKLKFNKVTANKGSKFILTPSKNAYISTTINVNNVNIIEAVQNTTIKIQDKQKYQTYNYDTIIPELKSNNYFANPNNTNNSELLWPIVPLTQCLWKSNGQYYDNNNILDVNTLNENYETKGNFCENVYTASNYDTNQYVTNKIDNILYINNESTTYKESILNGSIQHSIKKLLIDNTNIDTASIYYNSNIKSLEFIFSGIKFNIKLNTKVVNSYIHLEDYSGFEAFVLTDYDLSKTNELYISLKERFILLINHQFYIDYEHEGSSNIKNITDNEYQSYADYAVIGAPYSIDFRTLNCMNNGIHVHKKYNFHKQLMSLIDEHNLWTSMFTQYDIPTLNESNEENKSQFISFALEDSIDCDEYVSVTNYNNIGLLSNKNYIDYPGELDYVNSISSNSYPYIITKADGNYNHTAKQILENVIQYTTNDQKNISQKLAISNILNPKQISLDEKKLGLFIKRQNNVNNLNNIKLSNILNSDQFIMSYKNNKTKLLTNTKLITGSNLSHFKKYISKLITSESPKDKLNRYVKTFTNNINVYVIPEKSEVKLIQNTEDYNSLIFTLSIPNQIKFNYGWFTPNTNNMVDFYVDDELRDILNVDLLQSNTKLKSIQRIKNYTGNKVFEDTKLQKLNKNYYLINDRSLLSAPWDNNYYRKYINENEYIDIDGHKTGIDDKSFFGSHCMVIHHDYILLDKWEYSTANDILTVNYSNGDFNMSDTNQRTTTITINISSAIFNHFINNDSFNENWVYFKDSQYTGQKNYINNTLSVYYNIQSKIEVELYAKDTNPNSIINIVTKKPVDLSTYNKYENYSTKIETKENLNTLTIVLNETTGKNIYPTVKIYKR